MEPEKKIPAEITPKNQDPISFFDKDAGFVFAFKKTEKLASAVYMVTGLFSDTEPMKWTLRKKVSELLSFTISYKDISGSNLSDFVYKARTLVLEIVSLLQISERGGLISQMNFSVLKQEFTHLADVFETSAGEINRGSQASGLGENYFDGVSEKDRKEIKSTISSTPVVQTRPYAPTEIKDRLALRDSENAKRTHRQNTILNLIRKKKELTIKDLSHIIKDCSEKTIQRELNAFIESGVLKRSGVRRWSKYSLA